MTEQQKQFLALVTQPAKIAEKRWFMPWLITVAQAILESATKNGWGTSPLFIEGNNPFGIKVHQHLRSEAYGEYDTAEYHGEFAEMERARFMKYNSLGDAFRDHAALFYADRYARVIEACKRDPRDLAPICQAIQDCGYSTDPHYAEKLLALIREIRPVPASAGADSETQDVIET